MKFLLSFFVLSFMTINLQAQEVIDRVVVVFDNSGSMSGKKETYAKEALKTVISNVDSSTHVGVVLLNTNSINRDNWLIPLGPVQNDFAIKVDTILVGGGTPLSDAVKIGADQLLTERSANHYGKYRLLVVTDGRANNENATKSYCRDISSRGLLLDIIGVEMPNRAAKFYKEVAQSYRDAEDKESLNQAIKEALAETDLSDKGASEDYELTSAFADGVDVYQVLNSIGDSGNHPIGTLPPKSAIEVGALNLDTIPVSQNQNQEDGGGFFVFVFFMSIFLFVLFLVVIVSIAASSN